MHHFQLFSNRKRNHPFGNLHSLNINSNMLVARQMAYQKRQLNHVKPRMFNGSIVNYANTPSATCGCGGN
jgi:hypothetical protein